MKKYTCKKCKKEFDYKEVDFDLDFDNKKIGKVTKIDLVGLHKNCGGSVKIIKND